MMYKSIGLFCVMLYALLAGHCAGTQGVPAKTGDYIHGTVVFVELEGGFYAILGNDGTKYNPVNLEPAFAKNGLKVRFQYRPVRNAVSIHMYGTTVEITAILIDK